MSSDSIIRTLAIIDCDKAKVIAGFLGSNVLHDWELPPEEDLDGSTPADKAGVHVKGTDKRLTIIQNASKGGL